MTDRQCVWFDAPYQVCVRNESVPEIKANQALVQTVVSAISAGTELLFYRGQVPPDMSVDTLIPTLTNEMHYPLQYGYACVGRVVQVGRDVNDEWRNRLVFAFQPHVSFFAACVDELVPIPNGITPEQAAFLPNMESAVNFVMDGAPIIGERVVILGQGILGLLTTALVARMPVEQLLTFDKIDLRRNKSREVGATDALDPSNRDGMSRVHNGADLTFELSGAPEALDLAINLTSFSGRIVVGSWYGQKRAPIDFGSKFHRSRIRIISSQVSTIAPELMGRWTKLRRMNLAWSMLARLPLSQLITHRFPIADAARAYELLDKHSDQALQVMLQYNT